MVEEKQVRPVNHLFAVLLIVTAVVGVGAGSAAAAPVASQAATAAGDVLVVQFEWLQNLVENIDALLQSIVDLLNTINELFGALGGEGDD
jgi:uncharacterized protein (DUF697 family)